MNKKRLFIALNLPEDIKQEVTLLINDLTKQNNLINWVKHEGLHLTLHFLGYLDGQMEERLKLILQSFSKKFGSFNFKLGGLNAFPNLNSPRVVFLDIKQINGRSVYKLHELISEKLKTLNLPIDSRPWQPHLTLGRIKNGIPRKLIFDPKVTIKLINTTFTINSIELMESILKPTGALYYQVISCEL